MTKLQHDQPPTIVAVGGGKGGIGKSVVSLLLAQWLARMGYSTTLVDLDLSGANLHTLLGIKEAPASLNDLLEKRADSLEEVALTTDVPGLRVICGAGDVLSSANPVFARKLKLMRSLFSIESDFLVLDLGAGTSFNVLDFYLLADLQVTVTTSEPTSIYNAYALIRNAAYRRLMRLTRRQPDLQAIVESAMDPSGGSLRTLREVYRAVYDYGGRELLDPIRCEMAKLRPLVLLNRVVQPRERLTPGILREVASKYLVLELLDLGTVCEDQTLRSMISRMVPLTRGGGYRGVWEDVRRVARELLRMDGKAESRISVGDQEALSSGVKIGKAG